MLNVKKTKSLLIGTMAVSMLISGCGVKKDSDDKAMLEIGDSITEVNSDGHKNLLDIKHDGRNFYQYDSGNDLLIASGFYCSNVSVYNMETGAKTVVGFPKTDGGFGGIEYEGQKFSGHNAWYEEGKVSIYASDPENKLVAFTFDCETEELADTTFYDIERPAFVRDAGNFIVYVKSVSVKVQNDKYESQYDLNIFNKLTGEDKAVVRDIGKKQGRGYDLIVLNGDKSKVLFTKTKDDAPVLFECNIPSGEIREVYKCGKEDCITGFTYALGSNKIYLRYGKIFYGLFDYRCLPNQTMVITTDGRNYKLHSSLINGYEIHNTGIVVY